MCEAKAEKVHLQRVQMDLRTYFYNSFKRLFDRHLSHRRLPNLTYFDNSK